MLKIGISISARSHLLTFFSLLLLLSAGQEIITCRSVILLQNKMQSLVLQILWECLKTDHWSFLLIYYTMNMENIYNSHFCYPRTRSEVEMKLLLSFIEVPDFKIIPSNTFLQHGLIFHSCRVLVNHHPTLSLRKEKKSQKLPHCLSQWSLFSLPSVQSMIILKIRKDCLRSKSNYICFTRETKAAAPT